MSKTIQLGGKEYQVRFRQRARLRYEAEKGNTILSDWEKIGKDLSAGMYGSILHIIYIMIVCNAHNEPLDEEDYQIQLDELTTEQVGEIINTGVEALIEDLFPKDAILENEKKESEEGQEKKGEA